jgi:hypothetical protein
VDQLQRSGPNDDRPFSPNDGRACEQSSPETGTKAGNEFRVGGSQMSLSTPLLSLRNATNMPLKQALTSASGAPGAHLRGTKRLSFRRESAGNAPLVGA